MRPRRAADHSPTSSTAVMEQYSYTSTHPLGHTGPVTGKLYLYIYWLFIYYGSGEFTEDRSYSKKRSSFVFVGFWSFELLVLKHVCEGLLFATWTLFQ